MAAGVGWLMPRFDPRSRTGSDPPTLMLQSTARGFDPRSRTGSDSGGEVVRDGGFVFRSTLPHGERRNGGRPDTMPHKFRSTLPHGERHFDRAMDLILDHVSIHAPARGATFCATSVLSTL